MWYPLIEMGCHFGISDVANRITSVTSRINERGGYRYSFCAWYSLRMSF